MRKAVAMIMFVIAFVLQNKTLPTIELARFVTSQTYTEPWGNMPHNAWAWAEPDEHNEFDESDEWHPVVRWDADGGKHATRIYFNLVNALDFWFADESLVWDKAELFWVEPDESDESDESDDLPEWARALPEYELDDDEFII